MKKFLALILAAAMLCTMTTVIATAAQIETHLVGNGTGDEGAGTKTTDNGTYTDGLAEGKDFPDTGSYNVNITATAGSVEHRYAVDITYDDLTFSIAGTNFVWDVNTLKYVAKDSGANAPAKTEYAVCVVNYSDLPVYFKVDTEDSNANDYATITLEGIGEGDSVELKDAIGQTTGNISTSAAARSFTVNIVPEQNKTWVDVTNYYSAQFKINSNDKVMGTMSITLSKEDFNNNN